MHLLNRILLLLAISTIGSIAWLYASPPEIIRVGANYSAKIVCSNKFIAGRSAASVLEVDVQAPGHPILKAIRVDVDPKNQTVRAGLFGVFGKGLAVHRKGFGCTSVPDGDMSKLPALPDIRPLRPKAKELWPQGERVVASDNANIHSVLNNSELTGQGMRAVVIVRDGRIIAEKYAEGFEPKTPLLGWSMAKTITAGMVGRLVQEGRVSVESAKLFASWENDGRKSIQLADLLGMASDLKWDESYGTISDVTRLLYLEPDMAQAVLSKSLATPDGGQIGKNFNYSSGTTVAITRFLQNSVKNSDEGYTLPRTTLFQPLGMTSAVMETDARGNLVGGSYVYASARDWARFGQFLLQKGRWEGEELLPPDYFDWMVTPHPASENKRYGQGHIWLSPPGSRRSGDNPEFNHTAYWLAGHDGQSIAILPEENLIVVRLGLTPSTLGYRPAHLVNAVVEALPK